MERVLCMGKEVFDLTRADPRSTIAESSTSTGPNRGGAHAGGAGTGGTRAPTGRTWAHERRWPAAASASMACAGRALCTTSHENISEVAGPVSCTPCLC